MPEFNATLRLTSRYSFSAGLARGFRNPTIRELYLFPAPNPALQPEKLWNYQATFHARPASSVTAWTTFYYADLSNQVVTLGRFPNLRLANTGSALNRGIEANLQWRPLRAWTVSSGYAVASLHQPCPAGSGQQDQRLTSLAPQACDGNSFGDVGGPEVVRRGAHASPG